MEIDAPAGWTPPVLLLNLGRKGRAVTQEDVDRWVKIECEHDLLLQMLFEALPIKPLQAYLERLTKAEAQS